MRFKQKVGLVTPYHGKGLLLSAFAAPRQRRYARKSRLFLNVTCFRCSLLVRNLGWREYLILDVAIFFVGNDFRSSLSKQAMIRIPTERVSGFGQHHARLFSFTETVATNLIHSREQHGRSP